MTAARTVWRQRPRGGWAAAGRPWSCATPLADDPDADGGNGQPIPIAERLQAVLERVDRPEAFCISGALGTVLPGLEVAGLGPIGLPLSARQAKALRRRCEPAPFGKGTQTLVDSGVRRVWRWPSSSR